MKPALDDLHPVVLAPFPLHPIDQPMFGGNPSRPPAGEIALQGFRLTEAVERAAASVFDQIVEAAMDIGVGARPVEIVGPPLGSDVNRHVAGAASGERSSCSSVPPASASRIARSRRSALRGLLRR